MLRNKRGERLKGDEQDDAGCGGEGGVDQGGVPLERGD